MTTTSSRTGNTAPGRTAGPPTTVDVVHAVQHLEDGRLTRARQALADLWAALTGGPPWLRSSVAHWLAVAAPDTTTELVWGDRGGEQGLGCGERFLALVAGGWNAAGAV